MLSPRHGHAPWSQVHNAPVARDSRASRSTTASVKHPVPAGPSTWRFAIRMVDEPLHGPARAHHRFTVASMLSRRAGRRFSDLACGTEAHHIRAVPAQGRDARSKSVRALPGVSCSLVGIFPALTAASRHAAGWAKRKPCRVSPAAGSRQGAAGRDPEWCGYHVFHVIFCGHGEA